MLDSGVAIAILAGGRGTRLWPLSTAKRPKQFAAILPDGSMLQATFARARRIAEPHQILVVGSRGHRHLYLEQLPELLEDNLILEPAGRGTAAAVVLTAAQESTRSRFQVVVSAPADHVIPDPEPWLSAVEAAAMHALSSRQLVSVGSFGDVLETKFGYLQTGGRVGGSETNPIYDALRFEEKPDDANLRKLAEQGNWVRNLGLIAFRPEVMMEEARRHHPELHDRMASAAAAGLADDVLGPAYDDVTPISIDEAILQHSDRLAVVSTRIRPIDAGDFATLDAVLDHDANANASVGPAITVDSSSNTIVANGAKVVLVGVSDLVVVVEDNTVLVCPKDQTQRIREVAGD
jgi:mannose-1-phosphate guanylyltransferase/mannose-6-phosphate isomerase